MIDSRYGFCDLNGLEGKMMGWIARNRYLHYIKVDLDTISLNNIKLQFEPFFRSKHNVILSLSFFL